MSDKRLEMIDCDGDKVEMFFVCGGRNVCPSITIDTEHHRTILTNTADIRKIATTLSAWADEMEGKNG